MEVFIAKHGRPLLLGHEGENNARQIRFDVSEWETLYGPGVVQLIVQRTGEDTPYPVPLSMDGSTAVWTVRNADTAVPGRGGKAELQYYVGATLAKSCIWSTVVIDALGEPNDTPPEAHEGWVSQVVAVGAAAMAAADAANECAAQAKKHEEQAAEYADFDWLPRLWHEQYNGVVYKERAWGWSGKVGIPLYELGAQNSAYLKEGDTAIVYWDGQEYKRTVQYYETDHPDSPWLYIGNLSPIYNDSIGLANTGEPFCVILQTDNGERTCSFWTVSEEYKGQHTVAIYAVEQTNYLPDQFLPPNIPRNGDTGLTLTSPGGKTFRVTVDDNGALTATEITT